MKRTALTLSICTLLGTIFGALTFGCDDDASSSLDGAGEGAKSENSENTPLPNTTKSGTTTPPSTGATTNGPGSPPADAGTAAPKPASNDCSKAATQTDCAKCCGVNNNPFKTCACTAGSKCEKACSANFCADKTPDFACGLCLAQAGCDTGGDDPGAAAQTCLEQSACSSKPK